MAFVTTVFNNEDIIQVITRRNLCTVGTDYVHIYI